MTALVHAVGVLTGKLWLSMCTAIADLAFH